MQVLAESRPNLPEPVWNLPLPRRELNLSKIRAPSPHHHHAKPYKTVVGAGKVGEAAKARSVCSAAVDKRVRELAQPALDDFMADRIDAAELVKRKAAAREKAASEHKPLATLDAAFAAYMYTKAVAVREKAYQAYTKRRRWRTWRRPSWRWRCGSSSRGRPGRRARSRPSRALRAGRGGSSYIIYSSICRKHNHIHLSQTPRLSAHTRILS